MTTIARLQTTTNRNGQEELYGEIKTLQLTLKVRFIPVIKKRSDNAPDYNIFGGIWDDKAAQVGNAWKQQKVQRDGSVFEFLSVTIDDPSLPHPLNVAAFKNDVGEWEVSWRRRRQNPAQPQNTSQAIT